jgi:hypothetical protein
MPPRKRPARETVRRAEEMNLMELRKHAGMRHRYTMRLITVNEHKQDHRLNDDKLDHVHEEEKSPPEEEEEEWP